VGSNESYDYNQIFIVYNVSCNFYCIIVLFPLSNKSWWNGFNRKKNVSIEKSYYLEQKFKYVNQI